MNIKPQEIQPEPISVAEAWQNFLTGAAARGLKDSTIKEYLRLSRKMQQFAGGQGLRFLRDFDLPTLREFAASWPGLNYAYLNAFFNFARRLGWIDDNPAANLRRPKFNHRCAMPFSPAQMADILAACGTYGNGNGRICRDGRTLLALVLLLRYSGLRLCEAVALERGRIESERLFLRTAETGTPVYLLLPGFVLEALAAMPKFSERYFFCREGSRLESAIGSWRRALNGVFRAAGIPDGRVHQLRVTFAVELIQAGVPMGGVSVLLGYSSVLTTQKLLGPWSPASQNFIDAKIKRAWESDKKLVDGIFSRFNKAA